MVSGGSGCATQFYCRRCCSVMMGRGILDGPQLKRKVVMRTKMKPLLARFVVPVCLSALACGGTNESGAAPPRPCPPCPNGYHCAADVIVKDLKTGKIVCHPTYCVAGPDPICELDPSACEPRRTPP